MLHIFVDIFLSTKQAILTLLSSDNVKVLAPFFNRSPTIFNFPFFAATSRALSPSYKVEKDY